MSTSAEDRLTTVPSFLCGTAFKFDKTSSLVSHALRLGYQGFDTAAVTRAYNETLAGEALRHMVEAESLVREKVWIQTKFSPHLPGKDPAFFPYDVTQGIQAQVSASIAGSLANFTIPGSSPYLDAVVLHSPYPSLDDTLTAYRALEAFVPDKITRLGLSNIDIKTLQAVYDAAKIKPSIVQNRFTADIKAVPNPEMPPGIDTPEDRYDTAVRDFCRQHDIVYQPWGVLWGNAKLLESDVVKQVAETLKVSVEIALSVCVQASMPLVCLLVGTSQEDRITSTIKELDLVKQWRDDEQNRTQWEGYMDGFRALLVNED